MNKTSQTPYERVDLRELWDGPDMEKRIALQDQMQNLADNIAAAEYMAFYENRSAVTHNPLLHFYDQVMEHLLQQIPAERPAPGTAVLWYLYNMGFIIKTPTVCFGVDIHHRKAEKLEPLLDFLVITHNHDDHYDLSLLRAMNAAQKMIISNFFPNPGYTKAVYAVHKLKDVTIHCGESDHNPVLKNFTMPVEIICPTGGEKFVFFTSGDTCDHSLLEKRSEKIDLYAVHPRNRMSAVEAAAKLDAQMTFIVHLHEMTHEYDKWRWKFADGRSELTIFQERKMNAYLPAWGEKFIWDGCQVHPAAYLRHE